MSKPSSNLRLALRIGTIAWAAINLIHFTIWSLVCIIGGEFERPWWLWFAIPTGIVVATLWWLAGGWSEEDDR
jgi:hypothetical protein